MNLSDFGVTRQAGTTAHGIPVVVYEMPHRPIAITAAFNAGRRYDPDGLECLAHAAEHMLVAGTRDLPSKDKIAAYIERLGGGVGAFTGMSVMALNLSIGTPADLGAAVYLLDQLLVHSSYDEAVLGKELESVRQELAALAGSPGRFAQRRHIEQLFERTALGGKIMDNRPAIDRLTAADVRRYVRERLGGGNLTLVMAGGITLSEAIAALDAGLDLRNGHDAPLPPADVAPAAPGQRVFKQSFTSPDQVHIAYGFLAHPEGHPDNPALDVLAEILGGGRAATLARILRYETGLVYGIGAVNASDIGYGYWRIGTATAPRHASRVMALINRELERAVSGGITAEELAFAKDKIVKTAPIQMDSVGAMLSYHLAADMYRLPETARLPAYLDAVKAVSLESLTQAACTVIKPGASALTMCGELPSDIDDAQLF